MDCCNSSFSTRQWRWSWSAWGSLGGAERSAHLQVVVDLTRLRARVELEVVACTVLTLDLAVNVGQVIDRESLTLGSVEVLFAFDASLGEPLVGLVVARLVGVHAGQESVVFCVGVQLQWVLVVREQGVVSVSQVGKRASL